MPPIHPEGDPESATERIRAVMAAMLEDVQRCYRDGLPTGARWVPARLGGGAPTVEEAEERLQRLRSSWGRTTRPEEHG